MGPGPEEAHLRGDPRINTLKTLRLKKKEDRRLRRGHPWAFSNEFESPLAGIEPGEMVEVLDHAGELVGVGYANPHSLITVRLLGKKPEDIAPGFILERIAAARALRERLCPGRASYRAVYSESDFLPGLIVDKYGAWLSVQSLTAGMERLLPEAIDALVSLYEPEGIVLRNDSRLRQMEGLPLEKKVRMGSLAGPVETEIAGMRLMVDIMEGQKTGFFLDQVDNYQLLSKAAPGADVLDLFCHTGAWSVAALMAGANSTVGVDSSMQALSLAEENARINGVSGRARFLEEDAFVGLKRLYASGKRFGLAVVDPPAFIKSRAKMAEGLKGYRDLNVKAMRIVSPGGFLVSCSCSHHLDRETFREMLRNCAAAAGRTARLVELRSQSPDHPVLLAAPETEYLKCALVQLV